MHHPTDRIAHTTAFVIPVVEHWLKREIAQWVHPMSLGGYYSVIIDHTYKLVFVMKHAPISVSLRQILSESLKYPWLMSKVEIFLFIKHEKCSCIAREERRKCFILRQTQTDFIYGYMASDIWLRTILIVRKETCCRHIGCSFWLTSRVLLYAPSHKQDITYHSQSWSTGWNKK